MGSMGDGLGDALDVRAVELGLAARPAVRTPGRHAGAGACAMTTTIGCAGYSRHPVLG